MSNLELHPDRLSTTDEKGRRVYLYVADVGGFFRRKRTFLQVLLMLFFLVLPWIKINGHQAILLDIVNRHFEFFGLSLRAHNAPLLFLVIATFAFGLLFVTAVWGRIWCGWACPQTVFVDAVFRRIERWIEGTHIDQRKLDNLPWNFTKLRKRGFKWLVFTLASLITTHSFLAYFVGTEKLRIMMMSSPVENWGSFLFMAVSTAFILFNFGWFREQFCTIVCPYGRLQSVLMDEHSMIVAYDVKRGEPRATPQAKAIAKTRGAKLGDCVNCYRCVQVCPAGIDIRRGLQLECIACTACIDACDDIMTKLEKPKGLIRYETQVGLAGGKKKFWRPRVAVYLAAMLVASTALATLITTMKPVDIVLLRAKDNPYLVDQVDGQPTITNHFKIEVSNQSGSVQTISFDTEDPLIKIISAQNNSDIAPQADAHFDFFVRFPKTLLDTGRSQKVITIRHLDKDTHTETVIRKELLLVGPF